MSPICAAPSNQEWAHIIAVTNIGNTSPFSVAKVPRSVCKAARIWQGWKHIGERIDDRDSGCLGEFYDRLMGKCTNGNGIVVAR